MAIKGKKKSQSRGSQARRRPAAAPRAIAAGRRRPPWYKTPQGRAALIVAFLVVAGVVTGLILHAKSNSAKLADRQDAMERYTGSVRGVLQTITPAVSEMTIAPTDPTDKEGIAALSDDVDTWAQILKSGFNEAATLRPPPAARSADALFEQAVKLYQESAKTYALVPDAPAKLALDLLGSARSQRSSASELWANAMFILDDARHELEMSGSALTSPEVAQPSGQTTPAPVQTTTTGGEGAGGGGAKGKGGDKKGGKNGK